MSVNTKDTILPKSDLALLLKLLISDTIELSPFNHYCTYGDLDFFSYVDYLKERYSPYIELHYYYNDKPLFNYSKEKIVLDNYIQIQNRNSKYFLKEYQYFCNRLNIPYTLNEALTDIEDRKIDYLFKIENNPQKGFRIQISQNQKQNLTAFLQEYIKNLSTNQLNSLDNIKNFKIKEQEFQNSINAKANLTFYKINGCEYIEVLAYKFFKKEILINDITIKYLPETNEKESVTKLIDIDNYGEQYIQDIYFDIIFNIKFSRNITLHSVKNQSCKKYELLHYIYNIASTQKTSKLKINELLSFFNKNRRKKDKRISIKVVQTYISQFNNWFKTQYGMKLFKRRYNSIENCYIIELEALLKYKK